MVMDGNILDYFPYEKYEIREAQRTILKQVQEAIEAGKKVIVIQAPTGVGKSVIAFTLLQYLGDGYVCSSTKALQDQYLGDFKQLLKVEGRNNFECLERFDKTGNPFTCDKGACEVLKVKCERKPGSKQTHWVAYFSNRDDCTKYWQEDPQITERCPYWVRKVNALNNFAVVHNYDYILTEANYVGEFTQREVLVSDEGHNLEGKLIDFIKLPITQNSLDIVNKFLDTEDKVKFVETDVKMTNFDKMKIHAEWTEKLSQKIPIALARIEVEAKNAIERMHEAQKKGSGIEIDAIDKRLNDLQGWMTQIESLQKNQIMFFLKDYKENKENWVVKEQYEKVLLGFEITKIEFQPVKVDKYAYDKFFRLGKINVIMSATILDYIRVCSDLGLKVEETAYIEIEPPFPKEKHKIFNLGWADFGYSKTETRKDEEDFYKAVVEKIDSIIDLFPNDRGIIHATSYPVAAYVKKFSKHSEGRLTFHGAKDRAQKLEFHKSKEGSVLVSPSMTEGVDLKDDLSRFQILIKVPFPDTSDDRIKRRMEIDRDSYPYLTAKTIIQSIGRSVRSESDHAITFTLDSRMKGFTYMNQKLMKLYSRHFRGIEELKTLECLKGKPEIVQILKEKVPRPKKEAERLLRSMKQEASPSKT